MVIDTSALVAVLFDEPERPGFVRAIATAPTRVISCASMIETSMVVEASRGEVAGRELDLFLHRARVQAVPVDEHQSQLARAAWRRYGKGRHPAGLNLGDVFAYALTRARDDTLLFTADNFAQTDVAAALPRVAYAP